MIREKNWASYTRQLRIIHTLPDNLIPNTTNSQTARRQITNKNNKLMISSHWMESHSLKLFKNVLKQTVPIKHNKILYKICQL